MKRQKQTFEQLSKALSAVDASALDEYSEKIIKFIGEIPEKASYSDSDIKALLDKDFKAAITTIQLFLGMSKDEFKVAVRAILLRAALGSRSTNKTQEAFSIFSKS